MSVGERGAVRTGNCPVCEDSGVECIAIGSVGGIAFRACSCGRPTSADLLETMMIFAAMVVAVFLTLLWFLT